MRLRPFLVLPTLALALPPAAADGEKVLLERRDRSGSRLLVRERRRAESKLRTTTEGPLASRKEEELVEEDEREYVREVASEDPTVLRQAYRRSTHVRRPLGRDALPSDLERTSVHGRTVLVGRKGIEVEGGGTVSPRDASTLAVVDRLAASCLPGREVALGEKWCASASEAIATFLGEGFDAEALDAEASGELAEVTATKGRRVAKLRLRVVAKTRSAAAPARFLAADLRGQALFAVEDGAFAAFDLEGTFTLERRVELAGTTTTVRSEGTLGVSWRAAPTTAPAGAAAPASRPASRDAALARQGFAVCAWGHRVDVRAVHCGRCGGKLDERTKLCPSGCPFLPRFCPSCGSELSPDEPSSDTGKEGPK